MACAMNEFDELKINRPELYELLLRQAHKLNTKGHDYGGKDSGSLGNLLECEQIDVPCHVGIWVRLSDKWSRFRNFMKQGILKVKDESIEDTLIDHANYNLLWICAFRRYKKQQAFDSPLCLDEKTSAVLNQCVENLKEEVVTPVMGSPRESRADAARMRSAGEFIKATVKDLQRAGFTSEDIAKMLHVDIQAYAE